MLFEAGRAGFARHGNFASFIGIADGTQIFDAQHVVADRAVSAWSRVTSKPAPCTCCSRPRFVSAPGFGDETRVVQVQLRDLVLPDDGSSIAVHRHSFADPLYDPVMRRQAAASSNMSR
ncbi:hypothetical protein [Paraburkholderia sp. RL18-101-BIB-B]|jgi:hypothetical protein